ncbi:MAG: hypothetical protein KDD10_20480 [Phaeodactylibacter sp.]|nr:hypothetical protein [Phaeodactylibacter sp.]
MDANERLFYKIEDFLDGKLPPGEAAAFEREVAADPSLAEQVKLHRFEREGMDYLVEEDLIRKLKAWETHPPEEKPPKKNNGLKWGLGLLAAIVAAAFFFLYPGPDPDSGAPADTAPQEEQPGSLPSQGEGPVAGAENRFSLPSPGQPKTELQALSHSSYVFPDNLGQGLRSGGGENGSPLAAGRRALASGQAGQAILEFRDIGPGQSPAEYELAEEYLAHAYYLAGQYDNAARIFRSIAGQSALLTRERAQWFLLLSLVPEYGRNKAEVDALLGEMMAPGHNFSAEAQKLKGRLEELREQVD